MNRLLIFIVFYLLLQSTVSAQHFIVGWANAINTPYSSSGSSIAADRQGNCYTVGYAEGLIDFDPGPGIDTVRFTHAMFICKQDANRNVLWVKAYECSIYPSQIALDEHNNVYIIGKAGCTMDFDPGPDTALGGSLFILKLDTAGSFKWVKSLNGSTSFKPAMAIDAIGNVYMSGFFTGTMDFDPGPGAYSLTAYPSWNWAWNQYICKLDSFGSFQWAKKLNDVDQYAKSVIAVDKTGNVFFTGMFNTYTDFDPGVNFHYLTPTGDDGYICKLDNSGNFSGVQILAGVAPHAVNLTALTFDKFDNLYATGYFQGTVDFDPDIAQYLLTGEPVSTGPSTMFILKLNATGNFRWAKKTDGNIVSELIKTDAAGNILIAGDAAGLCDFDPGSATYSLPLRGQDAFLSKLDSSGAFISALNFGGEFSDDKVLGLSVDSSNGVYLTGNFSDTADFNPGAGYYNLTSEGSSNAFIARYVTNIFPLSLTAFTAKAQSNKQVLLQWQTAQEENTAHFTIERSTNGIEFTDIGKVAASGFSTAPKNYSYTDASLPSSTVLFYRLKMVDNDGSFTYSSIKKISITRNGSNLSIYPNPAGNLLYFETEKQGIFSLQIADMTGRTVMQQTIQANSSLTSVDIHSLPDGRYTILLQQGDKKMTAEFVKIH